MMTAVKNIRQWVTRVLFTYRDVVPNGPIAERASLTTELAGLAGQWVAIDRATNKALFAAETPYLLSARIRSERRRNVAVLRAPDPDQAELVGLG